MAAQYVVLDQTEAGARILALLLQPEPEECPGCGQIAFAKKGRLCISCRAEQEADRRELGMGRY